MTPVLCYNPPRRSPPRPEVDIDAAQFVSERGRSLAVPIVMPQLGMVMTEGVIAKWTKSPGDVVASGEVIAEIETEKLNYDLEATESGIFHPVVPEGAVVLVDGVAGYLLAEGEEVPETLPETPSPVTSAPITTQRQAARPSPAPGEPVRSTPGARKVAANLGVDINQVTPTGPGGRVVEEDVRAFGQQSAAVTPTAPPGLPDPADTVPMSGMRRSIADHMRGSLANTAQLSFFLELDVTDAQRLRRRETPGSDVTVGMAEVLIKACAETLRRHSEHNTLLSGGSVLYFNEVNIGFAVSLKEGLIVPVLKQADKKSLLEVAQEAHELAAKARDGTLLPDDLAGGTFTISVLGSVDGFTPILNAGQSAILGVGRSADKPVARKGEVVVREMMTVSLTVDHQVIDGASAAAFLRRLQRTVESPDPLFK